MIQNLGPSTILWRQRDIQIAELLTNSCYEKKYKMGKRNVCLAISSKIISNLWLKLGWSNWESNVTSISKIFFGPNVTGTRKLFQKFWTTKFHQSEFGRQEPSTKRGSWDGHTQILTCFWPPPFYNHNVWKLSAHFFMTFHGYCSFKTMG